MHFNDVIYSDMYWLGVHALLITSLWSDETKKKKATQVAV